MSPEPESLILQLLRDMRAEIGDVRAEMATKTDIAELRSEMTSLRADVASHLHEVRREIGGARKELGEQIVGLRRAVVEYHTTVIGHGVLISDLEARLPRVQQHLNLNPPEQHWSQVTTAVLEGPRANPRKPAGSRAADRAGAG